MLQMTERMRHPHMCSTDRSRVAIGWLVAATAVMAAMMCFPSVAMAQRHAKYVTVARELRAAEKRVAKADAAGQRKHVRTDQRDGSRTITTRAGNGAGYWVERRSAAGRLLGRTMYVAGQAAADGSAPLAPYRVWHMLRQKVDGIAVTGQRHDTVATLEAQGTSVPPIRMAMLELPEGGPVEGYVTLMTKGGQVYGGASDAVRQAMLPSAAALRRAVRPLGRGMQRALDQFLAGTLK